MSARSATLEPPTATGTVDLSVVMPCLNEELTLPVCIGKALRTFEKLGIVGEVVIVDNGSTDRSVALAESLGARVVHQPLKGYGNALRKGFAEARGQYILMGDADDSYDFTDLGRFVDELDAGADFVIGNRLAGTIRPGAMPWLHRVVGNPGLTWFLNLLFQTSVGDTQCGMRAFRREAVPAMNLQMPGMELASEMVIKSRLAGLNVQEIPITLHPDGRNRRPHLRSFRDGWRHLRFMLMCSPTFLFVLPGALLVLLGLLAIPGAVLAGYGSYTNIFGPNFMYTASLLSICGANLLIFGFLAKLYAHQVDPVFRDPMIERFQNWFHLERGLSFGGTLVLVGLVFGVPVIWHWMQTMEVESPMRWIFAGTLFTLGLETMFASFLVAILQLKRESGRQG